MAIPRFNEDLAIISKLGDNPGSDNNLTTDAFRAKFDEGPLKIQNYLNDVLIPAAEQSSSPQEGLSMQGAINMNGQKLNGIAAPDADDEAANKGYVDANKVDKSRVVNNFDTTEAGFVADARALKVLNDTKLSMELLWQNASHASAFAAQVVSLDLSNYDQVAIVFGFDGNFQWLSGLCVFNKNLQTGARVSEVFDQYGISRKITKITDDGVYFGGSVLTTLGGGSYSDTNTHMIPYQIYGIKRGQVAA